MLAAHPHIELRLFNPFANRSNRLADYASDFARLNRRMHNKSFTVDNQATIVGGRNIGDEYFGASDAMDFADLDVIAAGAVVRDVSAQFDAYWNSAPAYPARSLVGPSNADDAAKVQAGWTTLLGEPRASRYVDAVRETPLVRELLAGRLPLEWVSARLVYDDPAKVLNPPERAELHMLPRLQAALGKPLVELDLVSPYFVPTDDGTRALRTLADAGVQVRVLTNSLSATDVAPVYAGYAKYREPLLRGGNVQLFELKRTALQESEPSDKKRGGIGSSADAGLARQDLCGRPAAHLRRLVQPRPTFSEAQYRDGCRARQCVAGVATVGPVHAGAPAHQLRSAPGGRVEWVEQTSGGEVVHTKSPETGPLRRLWVGFLSILPIEWLL
jgi:putative cardiolipin synthase